MTMQNDPRHQARERALALLYEADVKDVAVHDVVESLAVRPEPAVTALLDAVGARADEIDALIAGAAVGWQIDRMAVVDRNVLRLAVAELLDAPGTPTAVVLDEAVELATVYSTDDSGRFVNGVLATLATKIRG